jgi:HK97 family phage prohead protease
MESVIFRAAESEPESDGARSVVVTASTDERDRYGDRILVDGKLDSKRYGDGWQLKAFKRNPVLLLSHDYGALPIGAVTKLWTDSARGVKRLRAQMTFASSSATANEVLALYREGVMRSVSVGFLPLKVHRPGSDEERKELGLGPYGVLHATSELWELSCVSLPANPGAVVEGLTCDQRTGLCRLADVAAADGHRDFGYAIRSVLGRARSTVDLGAREPLDALLRNTEDLGRLVDQVRRGARALTRTGQEAVDAMARCVTELEEATGADDDDLYSELF